MSLIEFSSPSCIWLSSYTKNLNNKKQTSVGAVGRLLKVQKILFSSEFLRGKILEFCGGKKVKNLEYVLKDKLMFYNRLRAGLVRMGIFQRIGIPRTQLPLAVQFGGDKSFYVLSKHSTEWHSLCQSLGSSGCAVCLVPAAITAEMSPDRSPSTRQARSWAGQ